MDSLLLNYASSDEEDHEPQIPAPPLPSKTTSSSSSPSSSLPQSKSSSPLFQSLPQPKSSSSLFQSIPQPKQPSSATATATRSNLTETPSLPNPKSQIDKQQQPPKKVVQFKPPIIPLTKPTQFEDDDDDEDEEDERNRRRKLESSIEAPSVKSFLSTLLPAPRNSATLGVQSSSGSGRRSIIETETDAPAPAANSGGGSTAVSEVPVDQSAGDYGNYQYANYQYAPEQYGDYANYQYNSGFEPEAGVATATSYENSDNAYASYGAYGDYGQYGNNWVDGSAATAPEASGIGDSGVRIPGKRGRNEVPAEVIEVSQEELIKNRPREDQAKLTGIAFGPAYQPVSTKGKPSKLHKRKHQIDSLYFDMKQNEMKLAERRSKGMLTKAETQAKYGW